ncbi:hypothetical protein HOE04_00920 [archaeon]|jgi:hypothetical protein|nr:hypothetical protein [archaeon]
MKRELLMVICLLVVVVGVVSVFGSLNPTGGSGDWTKFQWDTDKDDDPINGITPARDEPNNWPSATPDQIKTLTNDELSKANSEQIDAISKDLTNKQWEYIIDKEYDLKTGEGLEGATKTGDIITKDGASIKLKDGGLQFESDSTIDFVEQNGKTYAKITDSNGKLLAAGAEISPAFGYAGLEPRAMPPGTQPPGQPQSSGGGGGGGGGGDDIGARAQQGMQIAQQIAGMLEGLKGGQGGSNGQGDTEIASNAEGGAEVRLDNGAEFYVEDEEEENQVKLAQSDDSVESVTTIESGIDKMVAETNVEATVYEQVTISTSPETPPTDILLAGIAGDSPLQDAIDSALTQEYYGGGISAAAISDLSGGQFVKLIEHDLGLGGRKIIVDLFKSFNSLEGDGDELWVRNGEADMKFQGMKIYYSRKIGYVPNSVGEISNIQDRDRVFSLIKYRDDRARLLEGNNRVSIGDMGVEHPRESGLQVAKVREGMWVER